ncbi:MAG: hypothetical protein JSR43_08310 [Proteobacteria bacterium]|nr:hypothetical protein [Pseudomonadota bacterium]
MKYLLVLLVIGVAVAWLAGARRRDLGARRGAGGSRERARRPGAEPATMLACAHCGVHLPQPDALFDAAGRPYCSEAHRLGGPR